MYFNLHTSTIPRFLFQNGICLNANQADFHLEGHIYMRDTPGHNYMRHAYLANFMIVTGGSRIS